MHFLIEGDKMLLEITQQIIEILNKATPALDSADLNGTERQEVVDTLNKLIDINQTNLDILYPDRNKVYAYGVPSNRVTVQYIK